MDRESLVAYWVDSSDRDFQAMQHLFEKGDYSWTLFIGHLVIEKLLKAHYVKKIDMHPPFVHDLLRLTRKSNLKMSESQEDMLDTLSTFNIRARYDDYKLEFYKMCTEEFTTKWVKNIIGLREWIKTQLLKQ